MLQSSVATGGTSEVSGLTGSSDFVTVPGQFISALFEGALHNKSCHEACNVWFKSESVPFFGSGALRPKP